MIDVISGEEPPVELSDEAVRNFGVPHPGWFLSTVILQFLVLFFIAAAKLHAMPQSTVLKIEAFADFTSRDRFRGNYINGIILYPAKSINLPKTQPKNMVLVFDTTDGSKNCSEKLAAKMIRIDTGDAQSSNSCQSPTEVALKTSISGARFSSSSQMLSIDTPPFFIAENAASSICLREDQSVPATFELAVDKDGNAKILSVYHLRRKA